MRSLALAIAAVLLLAGCTTTAVTTVTPSTLWDSSAVHDIDLQIDDYDDVIAAYVDGEEKIWSTATLTIDGTVIENVGVKLKGNSTLRGTDASSDPSTLPWLVKLDKYVDAQTYDGETAFVVRGNNSASALNEAVALELLGQAGLTTEQSVSSRFSVNGHAEQLRLVMQSLDETLDDDGVLLYKAEAGGDYSYRGTDAAAYVDVFDQQSGDDNLEPLTSFLEFINDSDDAAFASELGTYLDVDAFATYLAFQDLVDNYDDIDGPGNNSYLAYDETSGLMTVTNWDLNLTFGVTNRPNGGGAGGGNRPQNGGGGGGPSSGNILSERFLENADFAALVATASATLTTTLFASGDAQRILDDRVAVLEAQAGDLVAAATVESEAASIAAYF